MKCINDEQLAQQLYDELADKSFATHINSTSSELADQSLLDFNTTMIVITYSTIEACSPLPIQLCKAVQT